MNGRSWLPKDKRVVAVFSSYTHELDLHLRVQTKKTTDSCPAFGTGPRHKNSLELSPRL